MRIAIIGTRGLTNYSGVERTLIEVGSRLAALGHEIDVYGTERDPVIDLPAGLRHIHSPALRGKYTETISGSFLSTVRALSGRYDVINMIAVGPGILSPLPRLLRTPVVVTIQGLDWARDKWPRPARMALQAAERTIVASADQITVVSRQLVDYFKSRYGRDVLHVPNGTTLRPGAADAATLGEMGLSDGGFVLFASRLVPEKGAHELIAAFNRIDSGMKLVIAGGDRYDVDYVNALRRADETGRCVFTGHLNGAKLDAVFRGAGLYVLPSHIEGLSLSLLEALGYGKAILVSDIPENLEAVGDSAARFAVSDVDSLTRTLATLLGSGDMRRDLAARAAERAKTLYDWDKVAEGYLEVFTAAAQRRASPPRFA